MPGVAHELRFEPPSRHDVLRLQEWLQMAELPAPPLKLMPGVEASTSR